MRAVLLCVLLVVLLVALALLAGARSPRRGKTGAVGGAEGPEGARLRRDPPANAIVILVRAGPSERELFMVKERDGRFGFPGGIIETGDAGPFAAAQREFTEETARPFPGVSDVEAYLWGDTVIYVAETADGIPEGPVSNGDGEVEATYWVPLGHVKTALRRGAPWRLRPCAEGSTRALLRVSPALAAAK